MSGLTLEELAARAGASAELIARHARLGILEPSEEPGPFRDGDVYRVRLLVACEAAGMRAEAVAHALGEGKISQPVSVFEAVEPAARA